MKHLRTLSGICLTTALCAASLVGPVFAQATPSAGTVPPVTAQISSGLSGAANASGYANQQTNLPQVVGRLIATALGLLGVVLLAYILYGGYLWMTAQGDAKRVDTARDTIKNAVIGLIIIVSAYAITNFVIASLGNALTGTAGGVTVTG